MEISAKHPAGASGPDQLPQTGLDGHPVECEHVCMCSLQPEHRMCFLFVTLETKQRVHGDRWVHLLELAVKVVGAHNSASLVFST